MRRTFLLLVLLLSPLFSHAYYSHEYDIKWTTEDSIFVTTTENAIAYRLPGRVIYHEWRASANNRSNPREIINYDNFRTKKIRKTLTAQVRGYCNRYAQLHYDTYAVEINGSIYLLPAQYVSDNSIINTINDELSTTYENYVNEMTEISEEFDSLRSQYLPICRQKYEYYNNLNQILPAQIDSVKAQAGLDYKQMLEEEYNIWYNSLSTSAKRAYDRIAITFAGFCSTNSVGGKDARFIYINKSDKTIKYLYWTGTFYNTVDDISFCDVRGNCSYTGKDTGPVAPGERGGGEWECVIYDWSASYIKLTEVSIKYTDGTSFTIEAKDLARLLKGPDNLTYSNKIVVNTHGTEYQYISDRSKPYISQQQQVSKEVRTWESRLLKLEKNDYDYISSSETEEYKSLFERLKVLYSQYMNIDKKINTFKKMNLL